MAKDFLTVRGKKITSVGVAIDCIKSHKALAQRFIDSRGLTGQITPDKIIEVLRQLIEE